MTPPRRPLRTVLAALGIAAAALAMPSPGAAQDADRSYLLATAGTGGTYYPVGVAIATLVAVKLEPQHGISMSAITSAGSGENIRLLAEDQAQFAILQGLWGAHARQGTGPVEPMGAQEDLRAITMLWQNVEHFTVRDDYVESGTIDDLMNLEGHGFAIGARNSGTEGSNRHLLAGLGIEDPEAFFDVAFIGYSPSADAFQNGNIDALNTAAGVPVGAMTRLKAAVGEEAVILSFTDEQIAAADQGFDLWTAYVIPAGTYPGQPEDVRTIAQPNLLAVNASVDEEAVYQITRAIYENLPFLHNIHAATTAMSLDGALAGLPLPLHPGALRYYEEAGIDIPDRLRP
ncbi:MAG: TAXI family TRAP transporter solute-binding subunit [Alphaproteobacteria bacterium]|nr:TAXI family TRAP transporter solute-binding subunit [Alphaproteobacteria bacterium]